MPIKQITYDDFDQVIADNDIVLIVFWAAWSAHAQQYSYQYNKVADKFPDILFGAIDGEKYPDLAKGFGVSTVPSTKLIREGITIFSHDGQLKASQLEQIVENALQVDMDQIRQQLTEQQAQQAEAQTDGE